MASPDLVIVGGGQAGLATAYVARLFGLHPVVLDASDRAGGSWPSYYDSLTLFSPARFSALPGMPFPGDPDRHPRRDDVVAYLDAYARHLDADIRWLHRVDRITRREGGFVVSTTAGTIETALVIAASGGVGTAHRPGLPGLDTFDGTLVHSSQYRTPEPFAGRRVVVVGGGNSAVQIAAELAEIADVTIATRRPLRWQPQRILGRDFHWWLDRTGLDRSPLGPRLAKGTVPVIDDGRYRAAVRSGRLDHRPLFDRIDGDRLLWTHNAVPERIDALILATGYRPDLAYLGITGTPAHRGGVSTTTAGLGFVGLERQRSFASATLRGVGHDAAFVLKALVRRRSRRQPVH